MRVAATLVVAVLSSLAMAAPAQTEGSSGYADIIVRKNLGGVTGDHTDTRILVPLGKMFTGHPALEAVSTLILDGAIGTDITTVSCTPFKNPDGTGNAGASFSKDRPSYLSTNTVTVGSVFCG
ncbi:hypothetical protein V2G26_019581 [Clonostachys chloroleuca]|uniref:Uncharacterized protein n=1 Tax=Clonostachys chloroleuca TaxID=1926264 RepID=A0AA35MFI4_9HYPO|nr:unnamed protein product [Clonostachys chloroleuca]